MKARLGDPGRRAVALMAGLWGTVALNTTLVRQTWGGFQYRTQTTWAPVALDGQFTGNNVFLLAVWAGLTLVAARALKVTGRATRLTAAGLALAAAASETVGAAVNWDNSVHLLVASPLQLGKAVIHLTGYWVIFYTVFALILDAALRSNTKWTKAASGAWRWLRGQWQSHPKRFILGVWLVLCASRVPYFLAWYPAVLPVDAQVQLSMTIGGRPLLDLHPLAHTLLLGLFGKIGVALGSATLGLGLYSAFLIMASSAAFTYAVVALKRWGVRPTAVLGAGAFFALCPLFAMYSVNALKDVPFAIAIMCLVTALIEVLRRRPAPPGWGPWLALTAFALMVVLWRSNGVHVLALSFLFLVALAKGLRRQFLAVAAVSAVVYCVVTGPVYDALGAVHGDSTRETLSLPAQQIGRAVHEHANDLTPRERELVEAFFSVETRVSVGREFKDTYYPRLSDAVRLQIDTEYFKTHLDDAVWLWADLGRKYPKSYVNATLAQTFGYWYPEAIEAASQMYIADNPWGISEEDSLAPGLRKAMFWASLGSPRPVPVLSMAFSIGFYSGVLVLAAAVLALKRRQRLLLAMTPLLGIWGSTLLSPAFAEFRYVLGLALAAPVVALAAWYARPRPKAASEVVAAGARDAVGVEDAVDPPDGGQDRVQV
ncbi:MAG: DUF6020 family protein [Bifidobacteriaceae bacterium]|jgi:hypothetical protein|nr:DUF6020 family protein [Bifidobacteriaceae bacterium]